MTAGCLCSPQIENYGVVPADVVLLSVHEPEPEQPDGICYLETKSLDGETNLKIRQTIQTTLGKIKEPKDIAPFKVRQAGGGEGEEADRRAGGAGWDGA